MKQVTLYYLYLLCAVACLLAGSCTDSTDTFLPANTDGEEGRVTILFTTGPGNEAATRAQTVTEVPGWDGEWNENKVTRLDLFVFDANGSLEKHYGGEVDYDYAENDYASNDEVPYVTWYIPASELSPADIPANAQVYLIANCPSVANIQNLSALQNATPSNGDPLLAFNGKNTSFVMDAKGNITKSGNDVTLTFDLRRAAAKILLAFSRESSADWNDDVQYKFVHYATTTSILAEGEDAHLAALTFQLQSMTDFTTPNDNLHNNELVLYSYANNWFDSNIAVNVDEPIDPEKQTYIMLYAPYDGSMYYYKVPVNFRLPENNDDADITADEYKELYCLQRNRIYHVTVSIDRPGGGTEDTSVELPYQVKAWDEKEEIDYTFQ